MTQSIVPISASKHATLRLKPAGDLKVAKKSSVVPILITEVATAAHYYPIVFVERDGLKMPSAILGLVPKENLFVSPEGQWLVDYIPATFRKHPFYVANNSDKEGEFVLCIDENDSVFSDSEGELLYDEDGKPTQVLQGISNFLGSYKKGEQQTLAAMKEIGKYDIFEPLRVTLSQGNDKPKKEINCGFKINEQKFHNLAKDDFFNLKEKGYLPLIYSHLFSMHMLKPLFDRLFKQSQKKNSASANMPGSKTDDVILDKFNFG